LAIKDFPIAPNRSQRRQQTEPKAALALLGAGHDPIAAVGSIGCWAKLSSKLGMKMGQTRARGAPNEIGCSNFIGYTADQSGWVFYDNCSFSIYKNNDAIATAGKTSPTSGTRIDGRFKLIIYFTFSKI